MRQFVWNAFATGPFSGNPAAVMPLDGDWLPEEKLQQIAAQNNLSETAFYIPMEEPGHYRLRWFTPEVEVDLCGHATLATAATVHYVDPDAPEELFFETQSGQLRAMRTGAFYEIALPIWQPHPAPVPNGLVAAIGNIPIENCLMNRRDLILELSSDDLVQDLKPDLDSIARIDCEASCLTITAKSGGDCDFVSRFFTPRLGVWEDPVTGSAHSGLVPYWAEKLGKKEMIARQVSKRGGRLNCVLADDHVLLGGQVDLFMEGRVIL